MTVDPATPRTDPELLHTAESNLALIHGRVNPTEKPTFFDTSFHRLATVLEAHAVAITGPALALYGPPGEKTFDISVGFPVAHRIRPDADVVPGALPSGRTARLVHHGSFDGLNAARERLCTWITAHDLTPTGIRWEVYLTEPSPDMEPADLRTELNWSVAPPSADRPKPNIPN